MPSCSSRSSCASATTAAHNEWIRAQDEALHTHARAAEPNRAHIIEMLTSLARVQRDGPPEGPVIETAPASMIDLYPALRRRWLPLLPIEDRRRFEAEFPD